VFHISIVGAWCFVWGGLSPPKPPWQRNWAELGNPWATQRIQDYFTRGRIMLWILICALSLLTH